MEASAEPVPDDYDYDLGDIKDGLLHVAPHRQHQEGCFDQRSSQPDHEPFTDPTAWQLLPRAEKTAFYEKFLSLPHHLQEYAKTQFTNMPDYCQAHAFQMFLTLDLDTLSQAIDSELQREHGAQEAASVAQEQAVEKARRQQLEAQRKQQQRQRRLQRQLGQQLVKQHRPQQQRSRSRSPYESRERNLAPKEWQHERARLINSKNFGKEARKIMEAPLVSAQQPVVPAIPAHPVPAPPIPVNPVPVCPIPARPLNGLLVLPMLPVLPATMLPVLPEVGEQAKDLGGISDKSEVSERETSSEGSTLNNRQSGGAEERKILPSTSTAATVATTREGKDWKSSRMVFVTGLRSSLTKQALLKVFSRCGKVAKIFITKKPPGYAYILFEHTADALKAVRKLHETHIGRQRMKVKVLKRKAIQKLLGKLQHSEESNSSSCTFIELPEIKNEPRPTDEEDIENTKKRRSLPAGDLRSKLLGKRSKTQKETTSKVLYESESPQKHDIAREPHAVPAIKTDNKEEENVDSKPIAFDKINGEIVTKSEVTSDKFNPKDVKACQREEKGVKLEYGENIRHDTKEKANDASARLKRRDESDDKERGLRVKKEQLKESMTGLDFIEPEIARFADFYLDYKESEGETPSAEEGDEVIIQLTMLGIENLQELLSIIEEDADESPTMEMWKDKFSESFIAIKFGSVPDLELIIKILIFHHKRSTKSTTSSTINPRVKTEDQLQLEAERCPEDDLKAGSVDSSSVRIPNTDGRHPSHQEEEEIDLFDSMMNAVADIFTTPNGIKLVKKPSSQKIDESRSSMNNLNIPLKGKTGEGEKSLIKWEEDKLAKARENEKRADQKEKEAAALREKERKLAMIQEKVIQKKRLEEWELEKKGRKRKAAEEPKIEDVFPQQHLIMPNASLQKVSKISDNTLKKQKKKVKVGSPLLHDKTDDREETTNPKHTTEAGPSKKMPGFLVSWFPDIPLSGREAGTNNCLDDPYNGTDFWQCHLCETLVPSVDSLNHHSLKVHNINCEYCDKKFFNEFNLTQHHAKRHDKMDDKKRQCPFCSEVISKRTFSSHSRKHNTEKDFECEACKLRFLTKRQLWQHSIAAHSEASPEGLLTEQKEEKEKCQNSELSCGVCQETFKTAGLMRRHKRLGCK